MGNHHIIAHNVFFRDVFQKIEDRKDGSSYITLYFFKMWYVRFIYEQNIFQR